MNMHPNAKKVIVALTSAFFGLEWLMLEVIRIPYRPPYDMSTFLGIEKYVVMILMLLMAFGWMLLIPYWLARFEFTVREGVRFCLFAAIIGVCFACVAIHPPWVVSPWLLVWN